MNYYLRDETHAEYVLLIHDGADYLTAFSQFNAYYCMNEGELKENIEKLYYGAISEKKTLRTLVPYSTFLCLYEQVNDVWERGRNNIFKQEFAAGLYIAQKQVDGVKNWIDS